MKKLFLILSAFILAGCAQRDASSYPTREEVFKARPQAGILTGYQFKNTDENSFLSTSVMTWLGFVPFDPNTGQQIGDRVYTDGRGCGGHKTLSCEIAVYVPLVLPPGHYALGLFYRTLWPHCLMIGKCDINERTGEAWVNSSAKVGPDTYTFTVEPNELVYIGDIVIDFDSTLNPVLSVNQTPDAARQSLIKDDLQDRMVVRPMKKGL
jgi:hypothetical protein